VVLGGAVGGDKVPECFLHIVLAKLVMQTPCALSVCVAWLIHILGLKT
jgi:hypothetical protein